jgi:putative SOS response-associated peptidase YedK
MCGRYALYTPVEAMVRLFGLVEAQAQPPRYNIAPTQIVSVVRADDQGARRAEGLRWGLVPFWAKELAIGNRMINARGETVAEKPAFRQAWRRRRCLIPADGFYEWQKLPDGKQPWFISSDGPEPLAFAGLWERWDDRGRAEPVETCTIITTTANLTLRPLHERMPVILAPGAWDRWLDPGAGNEELASLLRPAADELLSARPVSRRVNSPGNDGPELVEPGGD